MGMFPVSPDLVALIGKSLDTSSDPDAFRAAVIEHFRTGGAEFELRVQLCTSQERMLVEDASVTWPEGESPYVAGVRLSSPAQDAYSPASQAYLDDVLSFRPAHNMAAHRPFGSLMRARLATYQALSAYRHERNGKAEQDPRSADRLRTSRSAAA